MIKHYWVVNNFIPKLCCRVLMITIKDKRIVFTCDNIDLFTSMNLGSTFI